MTNTRRVALDIRAYGEAAMQHGFSVALAAIKNGQINGSWQRDWFEQNPPENAMLYLVEPSPDVWEAIETAPKDGTEFLSYGGPENARKAQPTRWLSPGPYSTENGKNAEGQRRYQYPDGFYWAGYDGFVGPVSPTHWRPLPDPPKVTVEEDRA